MRPLTTLLLALLAGASASAVRAHDAAPAPPSAEAPDAYDPDAEEDDTVLSELVVTAQRQPGQVVGDIKPEIQLDARDIRAYGAADLSELLDQLTPQISSGRGRGEGRPVVLLNGRRISGFREIRAIPPEAILRVDILPEEVALKYGYRADQRVVNVVLRPRFRAGTAEVEGAVPTAGGRVETEADLDFLRIDGEGRLNLEVEHQRTTALLESERDLLLTETPDPRPFTTLAPETETLSLNGTYSRLVLGKVSATLNAGFDQAGTDALFGLAEDGPRPLARATDSETAHLGLSLNGDLGPAWRWSLTANADRTETDTLTDSEDSLVPDRARSVDTSADAEALINGALFQAPAGAVSTTLVAGVATRGFESEAIRDGATTLTDLARDTVRAQANLDLPLLRRGRFGPDWLGDLSASFNAEVEQLSDFGALATLNWGLNWSPVDRLDLIASLTDEEGPPTLNQLGDPVLETPNVPVFDFATGRTVEVVRVDGGNPQLSADHRRVLKLGANLKLTGDLTLSANYIRTSIDDPIAGFPTLTPEIEAAFPDRFLRDASGTLIRIDARPLNYQRSQSRQIRWGLNFSRRIGPETRPGGGGRGDGRGRGDGSGRPPAPGAQPGSPPPAGAGERPPGAGAPGMGRGFGGGRFGGGGREGRVQLALYHTWRLEERILIRDGVPELDLLNGSATGSRGGQPEHELELRAGIFRNGLGARVDAKWQSGTFVRGDTTASDLEFSDLATVDLRLFANLGQQRWARANPWLRGARISLEVENLFDSRLDVRDAAGLTPVSYQPALLDPVGRVVKLELRKLIF